MDPRQEYVQAITRRHFFGRAGLGLGTAASPRCCRPARFACRGRPGARTGGLPGLPHFAPKAKRAIYLFMAGGPSQMDMLDYKPQMDELYDKDLPESIRQGQRLTTMTSGQSRFPDRAVQVQVPAVRQQRQRGSANCCRTRPRWSTTSRSSRPCIPRPSTTIRRSPTSAPGISCRAEPAWVRGSATGWAR
jgi:hypothetical protein